MGEALIQMRGVVKAFGPKRVYEHLDLDVFEGESLTIIGGSGQGKSVMLKLLVGLLHADAGTIVFDGRRIENNTEADWLAVRQDIGMLFQAGALFDSLSVGENVAYGLRQQRALTEKEIQARVAESLERVGLAGTENLWPADLSGGMKKRVGFARAIAIRPRVLLYDEPTTGLDPDNIARITDLIVHLKRTLNVTSMVVTHDMPSAFAISDRIAMIHDGRVIFTGTPSELSASTEPQVRDFVQGNVPEGEEALGPPSIPPPVPTDEVRT